MTVVDHIEQRRGRLPESVKKASQVVMARSEGSEFTLLDRKMFNLLLAKAMPSLPHKGVHQISMNELSKLLDENEHMDRIRQSLERLWRVKITIEYTDEDSAAHTLRCHYLSYDMSNLEDGWLEYAFDPILIRFLRYPKVYSIIQLDVVAKFNCQYALRLYEVMQLHYRKWQPVWELSMDEARSFFEVADKYDRVDHFKDRLIKKAVEEVNKHAEFDVAVEYIRNGRGGKIVGLRFMTIAKSGERLRMLAGGGAPGSPRRRRAPRDARTMDMFKGMSDEELRVAPKLRSDTLAEAARIAVSQDIDLLVERWFEEMGARAHSQDPDESFLAWLGVRESAGESEELKDVDYEALMALLIDEKD